MGRRRRTVVDGKLFCSVCGEFKTEDQFYKKGTRLSFSCKMCTYQYTLRRIRRKKEEFVALLGSKCVMCGLSYPEEPACVFDIHHEDPSTKEYNPSKLKMMSKEKIEHELKKCVLLCSNCHRIVHEKDHQEVTTADVA